MIYVTNFLLYFCFAILLGNQVMSFFSEQNRPLIQISKRWIQCCIFVIILLSFVPLIKIAWLFSEGWNVFFWQSFYQLLFKSTIGFASWIILLAGLILLILAQYQGKGIVLQCSRSVLLVIIIFALSSSSHGAAQHDWQGWLLNTVHFLAVTVWMGVLLIVGWFSKDTKNWLKFLHWFRPVAITCVIVSFVTGFLLMSLLVPSYTQSLNISYGQSLLIKHVLLIPLILLAWINGFYIRKKLALENSTVLNPIYGVRIESIVGLLIFSVMAVMGEQSPPPN